MIGGVAMNLWTLIAVSILNLKVIRFIDWAGVMLYGDLPSSHIEGATALVMHLMWAGFLGVVFAFAIPQITSRGHLLKGVVYGVVVGFLTYALPKLFQMPILDKVELPTVLSNLVGGIIWGLTLAQTLQWLDRKSTLV